MGTVLQAIGLLVVLFVLFLALAALVIWLRVRKWLRMMKSGLTSAPARIHLERNDDRQWRNAQTALPAIQGLLSAGFQDAGRYHIVEVPDIILQGLANPETCSYAAVYEHPQVGVVLDLVTRYEDGTGITFTTNTTGEELDEQPGHPKVRMPDADASTLYDRMLAERPAGAMKPAQPEWFVAVFQDSYAEEMDWRNSRGGVSEREIRAIADRSGTDVADYVVEGARQAAAEQALEGLQVALRERFAAETTLPVPEWDRIRDRLLFVHDQIPVERIPELITDWLETEEELPEVPEGATARQAFAALNDGLPGAQSFRKVGTVSHPLEADVYAAPEEAG